MGFPHLPYPLVNIQKAIEAMAIEIVDLPISMVMFHCFLFTFTRPGSWVVYPAGEINRHQPPRQVDDARERVPGTSTCAEQISQRPRQPAAAGDGSKDQRTVEASGKSWYPLYVSFGDVWWENK